MNGPLGLDLSTYRNIWVVVAYVCMLHEDKPFWIGGRVVLGDATPGLRVVVVCTWTLLLNDDDDDDIETEIDNKMMHVSFRLGLSVQYSKAKYCPSRSDKSKNPHMTRDAASTETKRAAPIKQYLSPPPTCHHDRAARQFIEPYSELVTFLCEGENCVFIPSHTLVVSKTCLVSHSLTWGSDEVGLAMASQVVGVSVLVLRYPGYLVREYLEIEVNNCKNQRKTEGVVCQWCEKDRGLDIYIVVLVKTQKKQENVRIVILPGTLAMHACLTTTTCPSQHDLRKRQFGKGTVESSHLGKDPAIPTYHIRYLAGIGDRGGVMYIAASVIHEYYYCMQTDEEGQQKKKKQRELELGAIYSRETQQQSKRRQFCFPREPPPPFTYFFDRGDHDDDDDDDDDGDDDV
ncbi:uncharacterized protein TRIREDRAFT_124092 [Trichoderma reesei QM6a]|uniref:Predicted protein n=1 Tax=Hypocrea jecorina (strain QM6a) TaxID=431241 RepID=G0RWD9_HYPJQ|nr:uncharacterized protein TRIREDRAFT_124092 [Trichoderma reesei QM6a]EGR44484.1 predicted protein [Trichoderma reesei QM6a]